MIDERLAVPPAGDLGAREDVTADHLEHAQGAAAAGVDGDPALAAREEHEAGGVAVGPIELHAPGARPFESECQPYDLVALCEPAGSPKLSGTMKRLARASLGALALLALAVAASLFPFRLPVATVDVATWPRASPPAEMSVSLVPTGGMDSRAAFAFQGGSITEQRAFSQAGILVRHPRGDLLVDTGLGAHAAEHFERTPWLMHTLSKLVVGTPAAAQLRERGYDFARLQGILPTHAHWDHVSGVPDFPGVPVWMSGVERDFVAHGGAPSELMRSFERVTFHDYEFRDGPYLGFPKSFDIWGDGSIVVVPAPGHTPGSVIVFVNLPSGKRLALLGDLVWQEDGVRRPAERPFLARNMVDHDAEGVRRVIAHVAGLAARFPDLVLLPAHDARAMARLPAYPDALR